MSVSAKYRVAICRPATAEAVAVVTLFPAGDDIGDEGVMPTLHWRASLSFPTMGNDEAHQVTPCQRIDLCITDSVIAHQLGLGRAVMVNFA